MAPALETCSLQTVMDTLDRSVMMNGGRLRPTQSAGKIIDEILQLIIII